MRIYVCALRCELWRPAPSLRANRLAVVGQAIREIERAESEARVALAAARAEEYRLNARRTEIEREMTDLATKIEGAAMPAPTPEKTNAADL